jgi:hypothetical protein
MCVKIAVHIGYLHKPKTLVLNIDLSQKRRKQGQVGIFDVLCATDVKLLPRRK